MLRRNRDINIFSMSALDLFASALGAFVILTLILLPYYLKTDRSLLEELKQQQQKNVELQQQTEALQKELEDAVQFALLGITTKSRSFVVLIDMSGSMDEYTAIMLQTVQRLLEPMSEENEMQLVGYHEENITLHSWQTPYRMAIMNDSNHSAAEGFIQRLTQQFGGTTPTHKALLEALKYQVEAIILLTDGAPDGEPGEIIADITRRNGGAKEIHCVALGDYRKNPTLVSFLEALAKANRGGFVGVSN